MISPTILCFDLGGTNLKAGLIRDGVLLRKDKTPTDVSDGLAGILDTYRRGLKLFDGVPFDGVAVSSAGQIDSSAGKVIYATDNLPGYTGFDLKGFLENETGKPVCALNDGHAAALAEAALLGADAGTVLMLTLGTGIGGAYVENGSIAPFPTDRDLGHLIYREGGIPCNCGRRGCIEVYTSGTALHRLLDSAGVGHLGVDALWDSYRNGSPDVAVPVRKWLSDLVGVCDFLHAARPFDTAVLGGGLADSGDAWFTPDLFSGKPYRVSLAKTGNDAGMLGAFAFFRTRHGF